MATRIRYGETDVGPSLKRSKKVFKTKSYGDVYVVLNEDSMHYMILDNKKKEVVSSGGNTTNSTILRLQAKKALENLGVEFADENRKRKGKTKKIKTIEQPKAKAQDLLSLVEQRLSTFTEEIRVLLQKPTAQQNEKSQAENAVG